MALSKWVGKMCTMPIAKCTTSTKSWLFLCYVWKYAKVLWPLELQGICLKIHFKKSCPILIDGVNGTDTNITPSKVILTSKTWPNMIIINFHWSFQWKLTSLVMVTFSNIYLSLCHMYYSLNKIYLVYDMVNCFQVIVICWRNI